MQQIILLEYVQNFDNFAKLPEKDHKRLPRNTNTNIKIASCLAATQPDL